jgi:hypothetical protein
MGWLRKLASRKTSPDPVKEGRGGFRVDTELCGDPVAHDWAARLQRGEWTELGDFLRSLDTFDVRDFYFRALAYSLKGWPAWIDRWVEDQPRDHLARLFRGWSYVRYAWEARGSGFADSVQSDSWSVFFERLSAADADLAVAAGLAPDDPGPWVVMITCARGRQLGISELRRRYAEVERRYPFHVTACEQVLQGVAAKWGGSNEMMFDFARSVSSRAADGSGVHVLIAQAHFEAFQQSEDKDNYWKQAGVRDEIVGAARRCFTNPQETPRLVAYRNWFSYCLLQLNEPVLVREQFEAVDDIITPPWSLLADPIKVWVNVYNRVMPRT